MKASPILAVTVALSSLSLPACHGEKEDHDHHEQHKIVVTSPKVQDVVVTQQYVCQIHSQRHIKISALMGGYLEEITIREGQPVKHGDLMFRVIPRLYQARLNAEKAEVEFARVEYANAQRLYNNSSVTGPIISQSEVLLYRAKLDKAEAKYDLAVAELNFATVKAPFDGIVDRLHEQQGSLIKEGDALTTLSDNSVMWVYFNVPERRYLEYKGLQGNSIKEISRLELVDSRIELQLADGSKFNQSAGNVVTIEGQFNHETGNIAFRADFPNPDHLLRHGQTGTVLILRTLRNALVIPQRATFETLDKRYVYVVGDDNVVHQRLITIQNELEDVFVIKSGLDVKDKIVLDGVREVHEGDKVEYEFRKPEAALQNQKFHAE